MQAGFDTVGIHDAIQNSLDTAAIVNATPTWTLANHDVEREVTRYNGGPIGLDRARAMAMVMLGPRRVPRSAAMAGSHTPVRVLHVRADTWLPIPQDWETLTVGKQLADTDSRLAFFRRALELRRTRAELTGGVVDWLSAPRAGC